MYIKDYTWISKEAEEAEVIISDGLYELLCFAHPFNGNKGEIIEHIPEILDVFNVCLELENNYEIEKIKTSYFAHRIIGILMDKSEGLVKVGEIKLKLSEFDIPNDISDGSYISFECNRIDL